VLISPTGTLTSWNNTFTWTGVSGATWYLLEVQTSNGTPVLSKWYRTSATGCSGDLSCVVLPAETMSLANGDYKWRIQDYGAYGYGPFTAFTNFTIPTPVLVPAVLISPTGTLTSWNNTFTWTGVSGATWYLLEVQTSDGTPVLSKWYRTSATGCSGDLSCVVLPAEMMSLANGDYKWRIQDYGAYGYGPFTAFTNFALNLP
jgi:hypothetical protein